jgi:hypothetical protein
MSGKSSVVLFKQDNFTYDIAYEQIAQWIVIAT